MDRRKFVKSAGLLGLSFGLGVAASPIFTGSHLEQQARLADEEFLRNLGRVLENRVELITEVEYREESKLKKDSVSGGGVIAGNCVLTAEHVVSFDMRGLQTLYGSLSLKDFKKIRENTFLYQFVLEKLVKDRESDMAVFRLPEDYPKSDYELRLADSDELKVSDKVYLIRERKGIVR